MINAARRAPRAARAWKPTARRALAAIALAAALLAPATLGVAQTQPTDAPLRVISIERPPFAFHDADGKLTGFSIDLWRAIAERLGRRFEIVFEDRFAAMLDHIAAGEADLAVANITINSEREARMDFSQPIYDSGLQILVRLDSSGGSSWSALLRSSAAFVLGGGLLVLLATAHLMWLLERGRNPAIRRAYAAGLWDATWWAFTAFAAGSSDRPERPAARVFAMLWMLAGVLFVSSLTASLTTLFTLSQLESGVESWRDLTGRRVGLPEGTSMERFAKAHALAYRPYSDFKETLAALDRGEIDATFGDAPVARYHALNAGAGVVMLAGPVFAPEKLGFAFPSGSPLRDPLDRALLELMENGDYQQIAQRYFGEH